MITELRLENWKSYEKSSLHIDPLTVLIGANASGKSNALDAFIFLHRIASGTMLTTALKGEDKALPAMRGGVDWAAQRPGSKFAVGAIFKADESTDYEYRIECRVSENRCDVTSEQLIRKKYRTNKDKERMPLSGGVHLFKTDSCQDMAPNVVARLYNGTKGAPKVLGRTHAVLFQLDGQKLRQEIQDGVTLAISRLKEIFYLDPVPSHMRDYLPLSDKLDSDARNIAGVIAALPKAQQGEIEHVLTQYASRLPERDIRRVYAETVGKFNSDAMLYCDEDWQGMGEPHTVDARGMSDGTLRFLAILTALLTRPKGSLLVVEEIDNGLHPSRASMLLEMLKTVGAEREVDVLVTTHNPALLDAMGTGMIPFITIAYRDRTTGHSVLKLLEDIKQLPQLLAQGTVGRLSSKGLIEGSLQQQSFDFEALIEPGNV
ncbi:ATPase [Verminephrobacter aporrectodeae subsp. tuberculatae]|uniref:AAA family ATPase n=1 Tax=Verminephrobacter aporrectodeae TaxID=1110389 RepID=UPI002238BDFE|nr:ATP-binding protein [Verminephrobacter aporrectodeae]MCW5223561.1 ATPase [Verminephrobacter aporrectodeae subsp. tuberculatae]MCW5289027.1 ATPase [Verminephrobacter aporrectodeae subsp. tuberculatae]